MSSRDGGSFRQPGGPGAQPPASNNNNNNNNGVKFAGEESKDKMYEPKHTKKLVRVLTVVAYIFSVSLAAIMLSVYYVFLWQPRDAPPHVRMQASGAAAAQAPATSLGNSSASTPAPSPAPTPVACECPPPQPPSEAESQQAGPPPALQPQPAPPRPAPAPAPAHDEVSSSQLDKQQLSTTQTPEKEYAGSMVMQRTSCQELILLEHLEKAKGCSSEVSKMHYKYELCTSCQCVYSSSRTFNKSPNIFNRYI